MTLAQVGLVIYFSFLLFHDHNPTSRLHLLACANTNSLFPFHSILSWNKKWQNFYVNGNILNILGFMNSKFSIQTLTSAFIGMKVF